MAKYSKEQRRCAVELYVRYECCAADMVRELGYPSREASRMWHRDWLEEQRTGVPSTRGERYARYTTEQKRAAVDHYLTHGPHDAPVGVSEQGGAGRVDRRARARRTPCQARPRSPTGSNARVNPRNRDWAADALKAVFSMESRDKALENAEFVAKDMESRKLREAAKCLREGIGETTTYLLDDYPREHRRRIRTNNMIERLNREIRRRTRVVGSFPDGRSALMRVCARYVTSNEWSTRRYLDMSRLGETVREAN